MVSIMLLSCSIKSSTLIETLYVVIAYADGALRAFHTRKEALDYIATQQDYDPLAGELYISECEVE